MTNETSSNSVPYQAELVLPPEALDQKSEQEVGLFFSFYTSPILFPLANGSSVNDTIGSSVIAVFVAGGQISNLDNPVQYSLELHNAVSVNNNVRITSINTW